MRDENASGAARRILLLWLQRLILSKKWLNSFSSSFTMTDLSRGCRFPLVRYTLAIHKHLTLNTLV